MILINIIITWPISKGTHKIKSHADKSYLKSNTPIKNNTVLVVI